VAGHRAQDRGRHQRHQPVERAARQPHALDRREDERRLEEARHDPHEGAGLRARGESRPDAGHEEEVPNRRHRRAAFPQHGGGESDEQGERRRYHTTSVRYAAKKATDAQ
jgi:hypothetical protein